MPDTIAERPMAAGSTEGLPAVPLVDLGGDGQAALAEALPESAAGLYDTVMGMVPAPARPLAALPDRMSRRWLAACGSPYAAEVERVAATIGRPGVHLLTISYEWGCTTRAEARPAGGRMVRVLDWGFRGLGRHLAVARQQAAAGAFFSVTWPGAVGVLTAMAPGRFAAALNQAPLYRRFGGWLPRAADYAGNAVAMLCNPGLPPDHLLRLAFETSADYTEARRLLERTPIAKPTLYALAGARAGEACVIERLPTAFRTFERDTTIANDWRQSSRRWRPRGQNPVDPWLDSRGRIARLSTTETDGDGFDWLVPPVLNRATRLATVMEPASGRLLLQGFEPVAGAALPQPATQVFAL